MNRERSCPRCGWSGWGERHVKVRRGRIRVGPEKVIVSIPTGEVKVFRHTRFRPHDPTANKDGLIYVDVPHVMKRRVVIGVGPTMRLGAGYRIVRTWKGASHAVCTHPWHKTWRRSRSDGVPAEVYAGLNRHDPSRPSRQQSRARTHKNHQSKTRR